MTPSPEQQIKFLQQLQNLFEDGDFVATYKYALLMSLAELAVESPNGDGELPLPLTNIAEKFAELFWPQTIPYVSDVSGSVPGILLQNRGNQATVVNSLQKLRNQGAATITQAKQLSNWPTTIRQIAATVSSMPIQYLQNIGGGMVPFLYDYPHPKGQVVLKPGIAFMLRSFHPLIHQLARAGWIRHVRENKRNAAVIGQADELEAFMFGSSRNALATVGGVLHKIQSGKCFYCGKPIPKTGDVDHFIPWSKYPRDLAHNFVLADSTCNRRKSDMLPAERHLHRWLERNAVFGSEITGQISTFVADNACSNRVTHWAYGQALITGAHGWVEARVTEPLNESCLKLLESTCGENFS